MLRLPAPSAVMARRSRPREGVVLLVALVVLLVGLGLRQSALRRPPGVAPVMRTSAAGSDAALRGSLAAIRRATEEAQLGVRVALPWLAEHGMPVTQRRLERSDALLSEVLVATARAESVLSVAQESKP